MAQRRSIPYQDHLLDRVVYAQPRSLERRRRRIPWLFLCALLVTGTVVGGCVGLSYVSMTNSKAPMENMARGLATGLIEPDGALTPFLDPSAPGLPARVSAQRQALTEAGLDWTAAQPIGFGGCMATLKAKRTRETAAAIGWLYMKSHEQVFGIEFSAREVGDEMRVTEIWKSQAISQTPAIHSQQAFESFARETPASTEEMSIRTTRYIFLPL